MGGVDPGHPETVSRSELDLVALCSHGMEDLVAAEARAHEAREVKLGVPGVVRLKGDLRAAYRLCLWSRCASRVLLELGTVSARSSDALYQGVQEIDWGRHLAADATLAVNARSRKARAPNTHFVALRTKDAIVDRLRSETGRRPDVDLERPDLRIHVFVEGEKATVSLDLSGESLHRRGYRGATGPAPLKETLAAAVLLRADWPRMAKAGAAFLDPVCGSGTLVLEAASIAADLAPGLTRERFGFFGWRGHDAGLWKELVASAGERRDAGLLKSWPPFVGTDSSGRVLESATVAGEALGLGTVVRFAERPLRESSPPEGSDHGLLAANPPYGERIGAPDQSLEIYETLGDVLRDRFSGWKAAVLAAEGAHLGAMRLRAYKTNSLYNGPIPVKLGLYEVR